jgi:hypothetical protein
MPPTQNDDRANWVSLKEASVRAGVSISWLRKQYRHNQLPTREMIGPRGLQKAVPLDEVLARAAVFASPTEAKPVRPRPTPEVEGPSPRPAPRPPPPPPAITPPAPAITFAEMAAVLLERMAQAGHETALFDRLIEVQSRAANAEAEVAYLLLKLDDAYAEIDQLRAQLAPPSDAPDA